MLSKEHVRLIEVGRNILCATRNGGFLFFFVSAQDEDLHVNERSTEQIPFSYGVMTEVNDES